MNPSKPKVSILVVAFFAVGLIADSLPHPALGPSLIESYMSHRFGPQPLATLKLATPNVVLFHAQQLEAFTENDSALH